MKILYVTTWAMTMDFFPEHFKMLLQEGHEIELACNCQSPISDKIAQFGFHVHNIPFSRSPFSKDNIRAYRLLKKLIEQNQYDAVHCHTPNASVITRLVCRKHRRQGLKVIYTGHGFHFFKGAPLKNWVIYFPIEWICSFFTDAIITINSEDYSLACKYFHAKSVWKIPGVGVNPNIPAATEINRTIKRQELGIPPEAILLLSVGEINRNKNHQIILKALGLIKDNKIHYAIAGCGPEEENIITLAQKLDLASNLHLLGYRKDIFELCASADIFCFPSRREGLGVAALEGMMAGLPVLTSNVHGINDFSINGETGFKYSPLDAAGFASGIKRLAADSLLRKRMGEHNQEVVKRFSSEQAVLQLQKIYRCIFKTN